MDTQILGKRILAQVLVMVFIITSCMPSDTPTNGRSTASSTQTGGASGGSTGGTGAFPGDNDIGTGTSLPPKVEIRHLIEPNLSSDPNYTTGTGQASGGSYVRKITLPKNFAGKLYVAGINISSLVSRHVRVRFRFGMNREAITLPATVVQAPGITPQTPISVLVLDLRSEPFRNVRLLYDLYDYNDYDFDQDAPVDGMLSTPVVDNRNTELYCRGLRLEDDPTFTGVDTCDEATEECLYSYAKVADQGLLKLVSGAKVPFSPTLPQVMSFAGSEYLKDDFAKQLLKPLADTIPSSLAKNFTGFTFSTNDSSTVDRDSKTDNLSFNSFASATLNGSTYYYRGPYRLVDTMGWQFRNPELDGPRGLFRKGSYVNFTLNDLPDSPVYFDMDTMSWRPHQRLYYNSLMFPRAVKLSIPAGVPHLSSTEEIGRRDPDTIGPGETTDFMDGSNGRAQSINNEFNHVGSCNVSASIEVIATDDNGTDFIIASSKDVKLQLVRPTQYRTDVNNEVLYTNFKSCSSNTQCGSSECCFNSRCWSEALVSQCFDDNSTQGNRIVGQTCTTDLECTSLCCNRTTGRCAAHNTSLTPAVLCSKPVGEFCIAKEWCQKTPITKRLIIRQPPLPDGTPQCAEYYYQVLEFGDCRNSTCVPPVQETFQPFDANAPGACNNAVPLPNF